MSRLVCVFFQKLQFTEDKVRWLHVYLPQEHERYWYVEIKNDPGCRDYSLLIKSDTLFLC